jgi:glutathione S-transferase
MVGDPSFCEAVELVELRLGIVFRIVAVDPVKGTSNNDEFCVGSIVAAARR